LGVGAALLAIFYFVEGIKALRTPVRPEQVGDRGREGLLVLLFSNPWLLAAVAAPVLILYIVGWVCLAALVESKTVGMAGVDKLKDRTPDADRSLVELNDVVAIWYERNVLLDNEPWPAPGPSVVRPVGVDIRETLKGKKAQQLTGKSEAERRRYVYFWQVPSGDVEVLRETKATVQAMTYEYIVYDRDAPHR